MGKLRIALLAAVALFSIRHLVSYGSWISYLWEAHEHNAGIGIFDEPSLFFYQVRDQHGCPHGLPRLFPQLTVPGPPEYYHSVFRLPGWIPALPAMGVLVYAVYSVFRYGRKHMAYPFTSATRAGARVAEFWR